MTTALQWFREGGAVVWLIALAGLIGIAVLVERLFVILFRAKNNGRVFIERTIKLVRAGKVDEAIKQCAESKALLADMGLLILRSRSRDEAELRTLAQAASFALVPMVTRRLQYLSTMALVAVMLGLLGAMLRAHDALSAAAGSPASPATGLANAFVPPAIGLAVATVLVIGRAYLVSQAEALTEQLHEFSARLVNALLDRPDVRLGHR
ncbi:MAG TPA: MotA/TolQ/ExbB proton channel family protein [Gemmatimonadaceae bacterium]